MSNAARLWCSGVRLGAGRAQALRKPCDLCRRQKPVLSRELVVAIVDIRTTLTAFGRGKYIRIIDRVICSTRIERTMVETLKHTIKVRRNGMYNWPSLHPPPYNAKPRYYCTHTLTVSTTSDNVRPDTMVLLTCHTESRSPIANLTRARRPDVSSHRIPIL